ncbi:DUF2787 family protein [Vibrio parahaemolyticus]|uniref:DUF2787 family protein n=1 Tax=Vibrio parahaemolyticus TaxID=670 RepID=UPI000541B3B7|nr:DUF2787 family protein [Vibrio parahaemolyticus]EHK7588386.1 DUF2787 family protein [Vibrio parahaemolyticus]EIZ1362948.1 DUF2787 family protein [Vibrio vulnificus]KHF20779.1 hypothetical protein PO81_06435 [Vibrio parahaemolyticus]
MIQKTSGELKLLDGFHRALLLVIQRYSIPPQAERIVLNCRQRRYYQTGQGLHPIEIQFRRTSVSEDWQVVCLASFSYSESKPSEMEPELYFHLFNLWCYQPDSGAASLAHPQVKALLDTWLNALSRHLTQSLFDDIQLSMIQTFDEHHS